MTGVVSSREALVWIKVCYQNRKKQEVEAIIDTGFSGFLTLPPALIEYFGFPWKNQVRGELADGSEFSFEVFEGGVIWIVSFAISQLKGPMRGHSLACPC